MNNPNNIIQRMHASNVGNNNLAGRVSANMTSSYAHDSYVGARQPHFSYMTRKSSANAGARMSLN